LLPFFYSDFKKDFIAGLTVKLANRKLFNDDSPFHIDQLYFPNNFINFKRFQLKDPGRKTIIKRIFEESGFQIARHIVAILPKIDTVSFS
jgi:hypothetical protein